MKESFILEPDFVVDTAGKIHDGPVFIGPKDSPAPAKRVNLAGKMLLPGFSNTHSHAFQRLLRGRVESHPTSMDQSDFWSWRTLMYQTALSLDADAFETVAVQCYTEMLQSGFTSVSEFHYLHHEQEGNPYKNPIELSQRLANAAQKVGIRLTLLQTAYHRNGYKTPALPQQRRFVFKNVQGFLQHARIAREAIPSPITHGLAIHSVRACPKEWIEAIVQEAQAENLPLHVHASEQLKEVEDCQAEHGVRPIEFLAQCGALSPNTTVIHATHVNRAEIDLLAKHQAMVSICPSTESNLGDGLCPIVDLQNAGVRICIGTDQHVRIDPVDELRSLEEHERLRLRRRHVLTRPGQTLAQALIPMGTGGGGTEDLIAVKIPLNPPLKKGEILDGWLIAGSGRDVTDIWVNGRYYPRA